MSQLRDGGNRQTCLPGQQDFGALREDSRGYTQRPGSVQKPPPPPRAFRSLVIFKASPRCKHSPCRSGFWILPTLILCEQIGDHSYLLDESPSRRPFWS